MPTRGHGSRAGLALTLTLALLGLAMLLPAAARGQAPASPTRTRLALPWLAAGAEPLLRTQALDTAVTVTVLAAARWQDAGVDVQAGRALTIEQVGGSWTYWLGVMPPHGAEGGIAVAGPAEPLPGGPKGALIGAFGREPPFVIGKGEIERLSPRAGGLYLRMNDADAALADNRGAVTVGFVIDRRTYTATVQAADTWQFSGQVVEAGSTVTFGPARGRWNLWHPRLEDHGPEGSPELAGPSEPLPGQAKGSLIGRIAGGPPFPIGAARELRPDREGRLELRMNDSDGALHDNAGQVEVRIAR